MAPASGAIGLDYWFYDASGNDLTLDFAFTGSQALTQAGHRIAAVVVVETAVTAGKKPPIWQQLAELLGWGQRVQVLCA